MTAALRIYHTHRPSLVSAPVAPMDEYEARVFSQLAEMRKRGERPLSMREWLAR